MWQFVFPNGNISKDLKWILYLKLNDLLSPMLYESVSNSKTDVSKLLNSQITAIVDSKCEAVRSELKKISAIG